jgi:hypothetical protein
MVTKMTLRLPDHVAKQLREASKHNGRSINDTAVRALARALGEHGNDDGEGDEWWQTVGDLLEEPPRRKFDPAEFERTRPRLSVEDVQGYMDALDWTRGDLTDL